MITLEQAKRLKAAGFPQGEHLAGNPALWFSTKEVMAYTDQGKWLCISHWALTNPQCNCFTEMHGGNPLSLFAAPNSDELLAAIQARWPGGDWDIHTFEFEYDGAHGLELGLAWAAAHNETTGQGDALLSALVDLYCELAGNPA